MRKPDELYDTVDAAIQAATGFNIFANRAYNETQEQDPSVPTPILDHLTQRELVPHEVVIRMGSLGNHILHISTNVFDYVSLGIATALSGDVRGPVHFTGVTTGGTPRLEVMEMTIRLLSAVPLASVLGLAFPKFVATYRTWQRAMGLRQLKIEIHEDVLTMIAEQAAGTRGSEHREPKRVPETQLDTSAEQYAAKLEQLLASHEQQTAPFRQSWNQLQKAGFRQLSNELTRQGRSETGSIPIPTSDVGKRITAVLRGLAGLGQQEINIARTAFRSVLSAEQIISSDIEQVCSTLMASGVHVDLSRWLPLAADLELVANHHGALEIVGAYWPGSAGVEARHQISQALDAYTAYKHELTHPEERLERLARPLDVVAMPRQPRPENVVMREFQRQATRRALYDLAKDATQDIDVRHRVDVVSHFVDLAESQRQPEDGADFGELFLSAPDPRGGARYFTVTFRAPDGASWALIESLRPDTATYVVPMDVVSDWGRLDDFISTLYKPEQIELGAQKVIHNKDRNAPAHIARIMVKIALGGRPGSSEQ